MLNEDLTIISFALGFVAILNLIAGSGLWLAYRGSRQRYLLIASLAAAVEIARQYADYLLGVDPNSFPYYGASQWLQFASTYTLALALASHDNKRARPTGRLLHGLALIEAITLAVELNSPAQEPIWAHYIYEAPLLLATAGVIWLFISYGNSWRPGRVLGSVLALALLTIRLQLPGSEIDNLYLFMYYVEYLLFPMMLGCLVFSEMHQAFKRVSELLSDQVQTQQQLQFVIDNSLDVVLVADQVGLLQTWNAKAGEVFGYTEQQAVGKLHMDDLFANNRWREAIADLEQFEARMVAVSGKSFMVEVRQKTVERDSTDYTLFVLRLLTDQALGEQP